MRYLYIVNAKLFGQNVFEMPSPYPIFHLSCIVFLTFRPFSMDVPSLHVDLSNNYVKQNNIFSVFQTKNAYIQTQDFIFDT